MDGDKKFVKRVAISNLADLERLTIHVGIGLVAISTLNFLIGQTNGKLKIE